MSKRWLTCVACLAASLVPALAQNTTGTISGVVRDPSNAVLPGARVIVTNEDTGLRREVLSNDEGAYRLPFLPIGPYSVRVEKEGFKSEVQTGVRLEILQVRTVEFTLELGALADTITVESRAPLLEAESSQAGEVIKSEQVTNLPLGRRNFMQLTFLAPMSTPASGDFRSTEVGRGSAVPASAGQRPEQNNYQIDGIDNKETGRNGYAISPPVDSISEFKVQTGLAPAEFGRGGGTIVNVVTKGGTNEYHGTLYEFLRNEFFDARPYFADRKSPLKLNQFGGALGGPIKQNKLFFFANYEGLRQSSSGSPPLYRVFTQEERNGIFATTVRDPITKVPFANNTIPRSAMDPISLKVLELVPEPNRADPLRNYIFNGRAPGKTRTDNVVSRFDYNLGQNDNLYGRYLFNEETYTSPAAFPAPSNAGGTDRGLRAQGASAHWNHVFTPALINNLNLGFTRYRNLFATLNSFKQDFIKDAGITNVLAITDPLFWGVPNVSISGYSMPSDGTPNYRTTNSFQVQESLFWSRGKHNFKVGGDIRDVREFMFYTGGNGATAFTNNYSGSNVADFLLGYASSVSKTARATQWNSKVYYLGVYVQDDWRVTSKLTLNLGFRYEVESALRQNDNGGLGFDVATGTMVVSNLATNKALIDDFYTRIRRDVPIRYTDHRAPYNADVNNIAPRVGFAYRVFNNTVLRGGYGIYYDAPQIQSLASTNDFAPNTLRPVWTASPTVPELGYNPEGATSAESTLLNAPLTIFPFLSRDFPYGKIQQWNFSVQQQLTPSLVVEGIYQGSNGVNLLMFDNINARPPGPGRVQDLLPYPQFARIQAEDMWSRSWYNGAAIKVEQRPWHGLSYLAAYTFSKSMDTASTLNQAPQWTDPLNKMGTSRGPSDFDARNRFTTAFEYALPIGRGKAIGSDFSPVMDKIFGGWGTRGTIAFQSGAMTSPSMNLSRLGTCATACSARPDRIGDGNLSKDERTVDRFFDVTAFRLLAAGGVEQRVGTAGRNILVQPGTKSHDLQVFKYVRFSERQSLEFRWEMYNAWNHANWGSASTNLEVPATFGVISSRGGGRNMQFGLKFDF
ncbi:MAG TPA: TonB-dependent receptor [Bryobacteraceae bacterium]|nr:TonB-dependent receptor [Bryobacteraceae bacterium]